MLAGLALSTKVAWVPGAMVMSCVTCGAGAQLALPGWFAAMVQVSAPSMVIVGPPLVAQIEGVRLL